MHAGKEETVVQGLALQSPRGKKQGGGKKKVGKKVFLLYDLNLRDIESALKQALFSAVLLSYP